MQNEKQFLDSVEQDILLGIARESLERFVRQGEHYQPPLTELPGVLQQAGSTFVTLTTGARLRGCIGHTEAQYPLAEDVARNAAAAARDFRFTPVSVEELENIRLEVTILNNFQRLSFADYGELINQLRPGLDGVMIIEGKKRALLLPQVWHRIPDKDQFLAVTAHKADIPRSHLTAAPPMVSVITFQAQHYAEKGYQEPAR